jgi:GNAT superfamily N-acetyltransferase
MACMADSFGDGLRFELTVSSVWEEEVVARLVAHNRLFAVPVDDNDHKAEPLQIYVLDEKHRILGGLIGRTHAIPYWLEVTVIWVHEDHRKSGIGRALMDRAEAEARYRSCSFSRLATGSYQAPGFYEKCGYALYGKLDECPPGTTVYYFSKAL